MTPLHMLDQLRDLDIKLTVDGDRLRVNAPKGALTPELRAALTEHKEAILAFLHEANLAVDNMAPPLVAVPHTQALPLSFAQQRLWFLDRLDPHNPVYNIPVAFRLTGALDRTALERSLNTIVQRHDILRSRYLAVDGQPHMVIEPAALVSLAYEDISGPRAAQTTQEHTEEQAVDDQREHIARKLAAQEGQRPFDLASGPLLRAKLLCLDAHEHLLILTIHHIIFDGWSFDIFFRELGACYTAFRNGGTADLAELPIQYADYSHWQRQWLQGDVLQRQLDYWQRHLAGSPPLLELPTDRMRPPIQSYQGATQTRMLPESLAGSLRQMCLREEVTLFMPLLAVLNILLYRYSGQTDLCVGTPIANRNHVELEQLIGYFANTLVLRSDLSGNPTFHELLQRIRMVAAGAYAHQDMPFEQLVMQLQPERNLSYSPLFQVMFVLQNTPTTMLQLPGLVLRRFEIDSASARFDLVVSVTEDMDAMVLAVDYNTDLFDATTIARMLEHFQILLASAIAQPEQRIARLPLLTTAEHEQLLVTWNATAQPYPRDLLLHTMFEQQVARTPTATALIFEGQHLSYQELNQRANHLANYLQGLGIGPDTLVGICVERSIEMMVGLLGILKAGGAYVPLDPTYPKERLALIVADTQTPILLAQQHLREHLTAVRETTLDERPLAAEHHTPGIIYLDAEWEQIAQTPSSAPVCDLAPDNLAYVIYTSGSTGRPKGVMIAHRSICNHLLWRQSAFQLTETDRALQKTSFSFDASAWELFWPLTVGAAVVMAHPTGHHDHAYLLKLIAQERITVADFVPSMLMYFLQERDLSPCSHLKHIFSGSEALSVEVQEQFFQRLNVALHNGYGPTEATLGQAYWTCQPGWREPTVPIGKPTANMQIYILDAQLQPVPIGVSGELYIAGVGLARGYFKRPELTAERFIPNPFADCRLPIADCRLSEADSTIYNGDRLYCTGDMARWRVDGNIEFLGRIDHQVKIRGFRIELGEIEALLRKHPDVQEAVVIVNAIDPRNKQLAAYIVPYAGAAPTIAQLREFLEARVPNYMLPGQFIPLDKLPLTPNGKLDRRQLPVIAHSTEQSGPGNTAPQNQIEQKLLDIWINLLNRTSISINDNFFALGGHSLIATQVIARIRETFEVDLPIRSLFQNPTIAELAEQIVASRASTAQAQTTSIPRATRERRSGSISATGELIS